jgi:hypothetical protein
MRRGPLYCAFRGQVNIARGPKSAREETSYQLFGLDLTAFERSHSGARSPIGVASRAAGTSRSRRSDW